MPTAAELTIILEAQDRASAQLRQVGQQVERLEQQVTRTQRNTRGLAGDLLGGLNVGAGLRAFDAAVGGLGGVLRFIRESVFDLNSSLERTVSTFESVTGSAEAARQVVAALRREAAVSPFSDQEILTAGRNLIAMAEGSTDKLLELVRVAEVLASIDPAQGFEGATLALREALSGDFESFIRRFEASREAIARFRAEGLTNLEVVRRELERMGYSADLVERLGRTFEGRTATIRSFADEVRQRLGAGTFERVNDFLGRMVTLIDQSGDALRNWADRVGQAIGSLLERLAAVLSGPLLALLGRIAPGLRDLFGGALAQAPQQMEQLGRATQQAAQAGETLEHRLARIGVEAAGLQGDADRVARAYDEQLQPLERQLRLLQQSAELQRVQNALASNRASVETMRLDREIAALQEAAQGVTDPSQAGLTTRQRMIALALQERQLRREELGLEEQRRPQVQSVQDQIARLQEERRLALEPIERELQTRKDIVAQIQRERQEIELARQDAAAKAQDQRKQWPGAATPEQLADARKQGEDLADEWLKGWQDWLDKGGGTIWGALAKTLDDWWKTTGQPQMVKYGTAIGDAIGTAAANAFQAAFASHMESLERIERIVQFLTDPLGTLRRQGMQPADVPDWLRNRQQGAPYPRPEDLPAPYGTAPPPPPPPPELPRVAPNIPFVPPAPPPPSEEPTPTVEVTVETGAVQIGGEPDPTLEDRLRQVVTDAVTNFVLSEQQTNPGPTAAVQGAGREP